MGTRILSDIHSDLKLLIGAVTGFEEGEEGFRICERFALSNIKHHRYLSVNGHATKQAIDEVAKKLSIHGKYAVAKKFQDLVNTFLTSFDFEHHPQYDLQWSLLSLLLNLSSETNKSSLDSLKLSKGEYSLNATVAGDSGEAADIDWGQYLKEGEEEFFHDYCSDSESEWSTEDTADSRELAEPLQSPEPVKDLVGTIPLKTESLLDKLSQCLADGVESRNWLLKNVQNSWWTELECSQYPVDSQFQDASLCNLWNKEVLKNLQTVKTLSEYQACREVLWMCHVPGQMAVFQEREGLHFSIRERVSIPSLTTIAFENILRPLCECFSMMRELELFGESLFPRHNTSNVDQLPPLTYEAYYEAVSQHLFTIKSRIIEVEQMFMKQDECNTVLTLTRDLKTYMNTIRILYDIHQLIICDWRACTNWECASKLLSGLYFKIQNSSSREKSNICTSFYLSSLRVYLNIIDTWLSEGRLEDWREEFVIKRVPEDTTTEDNGKHERFVVRSLDSICLADPVMRLLLHKVRHMGRNVELLVSLDRIPDMWKIIGEKDTTRISLNEEFLTEVMIEFSKHNFSQSNDETDVGSLKITEIVTLERIDPDIDQNITQQTLKMDNPFLMKAFEEYLPMDLFRRDVVDTAKEESRPVMRNSEIFQELEGISQAILPLKKVLGSTLSRILDLRYNRASKLVKDIMINEYKLEAHLKLMRCVYMMERGHVMNRFYQSIFHEIESNPMWNNSYFLTSILEEILSQEWPESSSHWSITVQDVRTYQVLQAVDHIKLHYAIDWPMSMVLDEEALEKYNGIFKFQLKLKWGLWTLDNLRFSELEGSRSTNITDKVQHFYVRRLECLRFWLTHAIGSIHAYLCGQVLQSLGLALEQALKQADTLDAIITVHNEYLEKVHEHCLQTPEFEDLMATIDNMLAMCVHIRDRWKRGAAGLVARELDVMESSYIKYHTYLALALHNAVQHKDADYYKLTSQYQACIIDEDDTNIDNRDDETINDHMTDLSRNLLTEIAHQSLPPSGISIPIPTTVPRKNADWKEKRYDESFTTELELPEWISLNEYEQTFSYLRWYFYEEHLSAMNSSVYKLCRELNNVINETACLEFNSSPAKISFNKYTNEYPIKTSKNLSQDSKSSSSSSRQRSIRDEHIDTVSKKLISNRNFNAKSHYGGAHRIDSNKFHSRIPTRLINAATEDAEKNVPENTDSKIFPRQFCRKV